MIGAKWQAHNKETSHCMIDDGVRGDHTCRRERAMKEFTWLNMRVI
jgi:hypothetical protein